ncbi:hypothetical protein Vadar_009823 [Vaccinium darrowii]|uniref:Uncharacterized protein n=1 Tax=Vaccinium darrowii TaxID=229202 RepID=A0ACB7YDU5_9ERIC|nr:hypothetical protein Vadar_009823 [Vaccinium darrowii]
MEGKNNADVFALNAPDLFPPAPPPPPLSVPLIFIPATPVLPLPPPPPLPPLRNLKRSRDSLALDKIDRRGDCQLKILIYGVLLHGVAFLEFLNFKRCNLRQHAVTFGLCGGVVSFVPLAYWVIGFLVGVVMRCMSCCQPPSQCGFISKNDTSWEVPKSGILSKDPDCQSWRNNLDQVCYDCYSCKAGYLRTLKDSWLNESCCQPPSQCGFISKNDTTWEVPKSGILSGDPDCQSWRNNLDQVCYDCNSCKAGYLRTLKDSWLNEARFGLLFCVVIFVGFWIAFWAFRQAPREDKFHQLSGNIASVA